MKRFLFVLSLVYMFSSCTNFQDETILFESDWHLRKDARFIGEYCWANRLQDWQIKEGRLVCNGDEFPLRTVQFLNTEILTGKGTASFSVDIHLDKKLSGDSTLFFGFMLGAAPSLDYRARALVHEGSGPGGGYLFGVDGLGRLAIVDNVDTLKRLIKSRSSSLPENIELRLEVERKGEVTNIVLRALSKDGKQLSSLAFELPFDITGGVGLFVHRYDPTRGKIEEHVAFGNFKISGDKLDHVEERKFGPIVGTQFTRNGEELKLVAQFVPIRAKGARAKLVVYQADKEVKRVEAGIRENSFTALFELNLPKQKDYRYEVMYDLKLKNGTQKEYKYEGEIPATPLPDEGMDVAVLNCNNNCYSTFGPYVTFDSSKMWFPHNDLVELIIKKQPDMLLNLGDQLYEERPTRADRRGGEYSQLDYLYKWYLWYWAFRDITKQIPSVCLVDDHDLYQGNFWGDGGHEARALLEDHEAYPQHYKNLCVDCWQADGGGFVMPKEFVALVLETQTSHLPNPWNDSLLPIGVSNYYTSLKYGGVDFALLEDRTFKSSPSVTIPNAKVVNGFAQNQNIDLTLPVNNRGNLFGEGQVNALERWSSNWDDVYMKVAVSQSVYAAITTMPKTFTSDDSIQFLGVYSRDSLPKGYDFSKDMDANGWPALGRSRALEVLRKGFAFHIGGDQHLAMLLQHGIYQWKDAGYDFCVPPIANSWPRRWFPPYPGNNRSENAPNYTGDYNDAFGNLISVAAAASPYKTSKQPNKLYDYVAGFGMLKFKPLEQEVELECWPRFSNGNEQFVGWPYRINVNENNLIGAKYSIGKIHIPKWSTIQLWNNGVIEYTIKLALDTFDCKVYRQGNYDLVITSETSDTLFHKKNLPSFILGTQPELNLSY